MTTTNGVQQIRIFIGSSSEARPVVRIIEDLLTKRRVQLHELKVIPWDVDEFSDDNNIFLERLLKAPDEHDFDFAIFVFKPDDAIKSRERIYKTPRDNVLFELGIFMSRLGMKRAFVLAPKPWKTKLKIMSDLHGFNPDLYEPPKPAATKAERLANLQAVLEPAVEKIAKRMEKIGPRDAQIAGAAWVSNLLTTYFKSSIETRVVKNFALDLKVTWNLFQTLFGDPSVKNITVQTLMMDGTSPELVGASGGSPTAAQALNSEKELVSYCKKHEDEMTKRHIRFECRKYQRVPFVHGFLMQNYKLLLTTLHFDDEGKMDGTPNPYLEIEYPKPTSRSRTSRHSFASYERWFDEQWKTAYPVWPLPEAGS